MNLPTLGEVQSFVSNVQAAVSTFKSSTASGLDKAEAILPIAGNVIDVLFPGLSIAGISASKALSVVGSLSQSEPAITAAFGNVAAAVSGGAAPTADQWAAFNAAADKAHNDFQAAVAAYKAGN